jgi:hypothetical protein
MGNQISKPPECSEEVLAILSARGRRTLDQMIYPHVLEAAALASESPKSRTPSVGQSTVSIKKEERKWSSSSEDSIISSVTTAPSVSPKPSVDSSNIKTNFEIVNGRRYLSSPGSHFFLPCDDEEADRLVILVNEITIYDIWMAYLFM